MELLGYLLLRIAGFLTEGNEFFANFISRSKFSIGFFYSFFLKSFSFK